MTTWFSSKVKAVAALWIVAGGIAAAMPVARADMIIIGTPGQIAAARMGHQIGSAIGGALRSAAEFAQSKAAANAEMEKARRDFLRNYPNGADLAAARERLASLLFQKDLYYLSLSISEGLTPDNEQRLQLLDMLTGGALDGGIHPGAKADFADWVDAVRASLGARRRGELLFVTSGPDVLKAIGDNMGVYERYLQRRDPIELARAGS